MPKGKGYAPDYVKWKPGVNPYAEYLKKLTPEQKIAHLEERKQRKTMKKAYELAVSELQSEWIARINKGMVAVLEKAIREGDPAAMACVFDRIIGKPQETINSTNTQILPWDTESTRAKDEDE